MADRNVRIDITARDRTQGGIDSANRNMRSLESRARNLTGVFGALAGATSALGISQVMREAIAATQEYEKSQQRLEGVLKATGEVTGFTRNELERMVLAMERDTVFAQNELRDATAILATFKSVQGETFTQGIELAADMSAVMDQSLKSSVVQLGKALEDPVRGLASLREVGVSFTAQQEEMIKTLTESGQKMEAQGKIIEALQGQFGGTATTMNGGLHGALSSNAEAWNRLLVEMGKTPAVTIAIGGSLTSMASMVDGLAEALERFNRGVGEGPIGLGGRLQEPLPQPPSEDGAPGPRRLNRDQMAAEARRAKAAFDAEQQRLRAEDQRKFEEHQKKLEKINQELAKTRAAEDAERLKNAAFMSKLFANEQVAAVKAHEAEIARAVEKQRLRMEESAATDQMINDAIAAGEAVREQVRGEIAARQMKVQALVDSLASEWGLQQRWYEDRLEMINDAEAVGLSVTGGWQAQRERLTAQHQDKLTRLEDAAIKKRYGINQVYRKLDRDSARFFFGQMGLMMESGSRKMFEIGKAGAIAETIINTHTGAWGAYRSLSTIPIVGHALGLAAAAAATVAGLARVQAIRSTEFGAGSAAVPTFAANPVTGVPSGAPIAAPQELQAVQTPAPAPRNVNITVQSDSGIVSLAWVRDELIPSINEAVGDGTVLTVN